MKSSYKGTLKGVIRLYREEVLHDLHSSGCQSQHSKDFLEVLQFFPLSVIFKTPCGDFITFLFTARPH